MHCAMTYPGDATKSIVNDTEIDEPYIWRIRLFRPLLGKRHFVSQFRWVNIKDEINEKLKLIIRDSSEEIK